MIPNSPSFHNFSHISLRSIYNMAQTSSLKSQRRIAIVGGGISGIGCLWGLRHEDFEIHLYEADSRLGGHANTVMFEGCGRSVPVDTGFIAMNEKTYPEFTAFLKSLNVETIPTDMSFGVSEDGGAFEWGSTTVGAFVGNISSIFRPWFWRLIFDIFRFNLFATDILSQFPNCPNGDTPDWLCHDQKIASKMGYQDAELESIGEYLDREGYSNHFKRYFIIPMVAAPWCIDPEEFSHTFPAITLIRFMASQGLLDTVVHRLNWRTIKCGSKAYIEAFLNTIPPNHHVHLDTPIRSCVRQDNGKVCLIVADGSVETFDQVVFAVHANQALTILGEAATPMEHDILKHFRTTENICVLHSDMSLMPRRANARASWNCLMQSSESCCAIPEGQGHRIESSPEDRQFLRKSIYPQKISVTFDMNRLQGIPGPGEHGSPGRVLVSMNPIHAPLAVKGTYKYSHPLFSSASVGASKSLHRINGVNSVSFAGAWMGYGFHEDGFAAGLDVARDILQPTERQFGGFPTRSETAERAPRPLRDRICRAIVQIVQSFLERFDIKA